jgi:hypothetical protein
MKRSLANCSPAGARMRRCWCCRARVDPTHSRHPHTHRWGSGLRGRLRQYSYFCTGKASKLSTFRGSCQEAPSQLHVTLLGPGARAQCVGHHSARLGGGCVSICTFVLVKQVVGPGARAQCVGPPNNTWRASGVSICTFVRVSKVARAHCADSPLHRLVRLGGAELVFVLLY